MHVQDIVYENVAMCDPSTVRGIAIMHFCMARRQGVKLAYVAMNFSNIHWRIVACSIQFESQMY